MQTRGPKASVVTKIPASNEKCPIGWGPTWCFWYLLRSQMSQNSDPAWLGFQISCTPCYRLVLLVLRTRLPHLWVMLLSIGYGR
jgi:hypothetical protein